MPSDRMGRARPRSFGLTRGTIRLLPRHLHRAIVAVLDACDVDRALLVGHSMGCVLSVQFALTFPQRTAGLVLAGGTGGPITATGAALAK